MAEVEEKVAAEEAAKALVAKDPAHRLQEVPAMAEDHIPSGTAKHASL